VDDHCPRNDMSLFISLLYLLGKDLELIPFLADHVDHRKVLEPAHLTMWIQRQLFEDLHCLFVGAMCLGVFDCKL